jgi:hypothetical protein
MIINLYIYISVSLSLSSTFLDGFVYVNPKVIIIR